MPKSGRPPTRGAEVRARLIALACTRPPDTAEGVRRERWTDRELAEQVGMWVATGALPAVVVTTIIHAVV